MLWAAGYAAFPVPSSRRKQCVHVCVTLKRGLYIVGMEGFSSDFSPSGSAAGSGKVDTGAIMEQVKVQIAVANAQELLQVSDCLCGWVPERHVT